MYHCSFAKTFWILVCCEVRAQKLIHDTNSMLFRQPQFYLTFCLFSVWNSMCPIMFYKLFNANSTIFLFFRSSHLEMFCKKSALRNFAKFTGKHLCQDLFFDKVAGLRLWHRCFSVNFVKFLRTHFLTEHVQWLLLYVIGTENMILSLAGWRLLF